MSEEHPTNTARYKTIADKYGTPIYVLEKIEIEKALADIKKSFGNFPVPIYIAYPYKTNSLGRLCELLLRAKFWAEVSSGLELRLASRIGVKASNIILNSPSKSDEDIKLALELACKIHIDHEEEIERIDYWAKRLDIDLVRVGLRIVSGAGTNWDKFGFVIGDDIYYALEKIRKVRRLKAVAFHTHRSNIIDLSDYYTHISSIVDFTVEAVKRRLIELEYLDLGSGFAINSPTPINAVKWNAPSLTDYARVLLDIWKSSPLPKEMYIILEPGRKVVASSTTLITRVMSIKKRARGMLAIVDAGSNLIPGVDWYKYRFAQLKELDESRPKETYDVHGCLCDSLDVLGSNVELFALRVGELLAISDVGGYDLSRSFSWQIPRPPIAWCESETEIEIVRFNDLAPSSDSFAGTMLS